MDIHSWGTNLHKFLFNFRLVSAYEDKVLGLSEFGEIFEIVENKTFSEFVDYILYECKTNWCNEHWQPQYVHCKYCDIKYNMIGRLENLGKDLRYIASNNNFTSDLTSSKIDLHVHSSGAKRFEKPPKDILEMKREKEKIEKTKRYFMMLNSTQLENLYQMYKIDFEMFGYSFEPYHVRNKLLD